MTSSSRMSAPTVLSPSSLELRIIDAHPMAQQLAFLARRRYLLLTPCAFLAGFVALAIVEGRFFQPEAFKVLCGDGRLLLRAPKALCEVERNSALLYAERDVLGLAVVSLFPLTLPLWMRQWRAITNFLPAMAERGILQVVDTSVVRSEVDACNSYFCRWARFNWIVVGCAFLCMVLVARTDAIGPVYPILGSSGTRGLPASGWWLSLRGSLLPSVAYFMVGVLVIYVILLQNIHGSRVVLLIWRLRRSVRYGADLENLDGFNGWSEVSQILFATWTLTIIHGVCLAFVGLSLPEGAAYAMWPLLAQWVMVTPFYLSVPIWITRKNIGAWRKVQIELIESTMPGLSPMNRRLATLKIKKIRAVKVNPYIGSIEHLSVYFGNIGSLLLVIQVLIFIYT